MQLLLLTTFAVNTVLDRLRNGCPRPVGFTKHAVWAGPTRHNVRFHGYPPCVSNGRPWHDPHIRHCRKPVWAPWQLNLGNLGPIPGRPSARSRLSDDPGSQARRKHSHNHHHNQRSSVQAALQGRPGCVPYRFFNFSSAPATVDVFNFGPSTCSGLFPAVPQRQPHQSPLFRLSHQHLNI